MSKNLQNKIDKFENIVIKANKCISKIVLNKKIN
jgi:hypothetical protein